MIICHKISKRKSTNHIHPSQKSIKKEFKEHVHHTLQNKIKCKNKYVYLLLIKPKNKCKNNTLTLSSGKAELLQDNRRRCQVMVMFISSSFLQDTAIMSQSIISAY